MAMTLEQVGIILSELHVQHILRPDEDDIVIGYPMSHYRNSQGQLDLIMRVTLEESGQYVKFQAHLDYGLSELQSEKRRLLFQMLLMIALQSKLIQVDVSGQGEMFWRVELPIEDSVLTHNQVLRCIQTIVDIVDRFDNDIRHALRIGVPLLPSFEQGDLSSTISDILGVPTLGDLEDLREEDSDEWI